MVAFGLVGAMSQICDNTFSFDRGTVRHSCSVSTSLVNSLNIINLLIIKKFINFYNYSDYFINFSLLFIISTHNMLICKYCITSILNSLFYLKIILYLNVFMLNYVSVLFSFVTLKLFMMKPVMGDKIVVYSTKNFVEACEIWLMLCLLKNNNFSILLSFVKGDYYTYKV